MIEISIVIPHYNNVAKLDACLHALQRYFGHRQDLEVIIVDNASSADLSGLHTRYANYRWLTENSMRSPYPCRNTGIRAARGAFIILLDSNCQPFANFLEQGLQQLQAGQNVVGGKLQIGHSGSWTSRFDCLYSALLDESSTRTGLPGGILYTRMEVFEQIGLFLPNIRSLGDMEWTNRAHEAGFMLGLTNEEVASYQAKEWGPFVRKMIRLGRGSKEKHLHTGGSLWQWRWWWRVGKSFLPPSPGFVRYMRWRDKQLHTKLSVPQIILYCTLTKWLRGIGMLFSRVQRGK
jgi:glycosyltransferase involved in cell wall biosynthesis